MRNSDREEDWLCYQGARAAMALFSSQPDANQPGSFEHRKLQGYERLVARLEGRWGFKAGDVEPL